MKLLNHILHFFPFRLLIGNLKRNHILMLSWFLLFAIMFGFGKYLGIPYLFLDPEYLNKVGFVSFGIMGIVLAGFSISFHITCYITDGFRYSFLGSMTKPFTKFSINNSFIPLVFLITYLISVVKFQIDNEFAQTSDIVMAVLGVLSGYVVMTVILYSYFWFTNKDIFKILAGKFDKTLKQKLRVTRANVMHRLKLVKQKPEHVRRYIDLDLKVKPIDEIGYDRAEIIKVFDQNHLNLVFIELFIFIILLLLGIFREHDVFQIPAAASVVLFLTIIVMFSGAFAYWFRSWAPTVVILLLILINLGVKQEVLKSQYQAFGLNYDNGYAPYNLETLKKFTADSILANDHLNTLEILTNWRLKFGRKKPKMILVCASGGGQRSALWTFRTIQYTDSLTRGRLMNNTTMITGASGGLIGAAYYRELFLQHIKNDQIALSDSKYVENIGTDNLNPIIFSFLVNDLFVKFQTFDYMGHSYMKDRGYSFEEQLNENTGFILDKPLSAYQQPEKNAIIPMMLIAPTIINDGRKLFISPQPVGYMNSGEIRANKSFDKLIEGVDFRQLFANQGADSLRFLSALRMCATFPYVTPNISLPSEPPLEIMDAGLTDNFGISDALRFLYAFRTWIAENTTGVVILSIRDSKKEMAIESRKNLSLVDKIFTPVQSVYENYAKLQSVNNDNKIEFAKSWFNNSLDVVTLQYIPTYDPKTQNSEDVQRASLNWRLTSKEKLNVVKSIHSKTNHNELQKLINLLQ